MEKDKHGLKSLARKRGLVDLQNCCHRPRFSVFKGRERKEEKRNCSERKEGGTKVTSAKGSPGGVGR